MKSFFQWVAKHAALSFFLGLELFCLIFGLVWAINISFNKPYKENLNHQPAIAQVLVIAEEAQLDFANTEMEVFNLSQKANYKVTTAAREKAIAEFAKNETAVLVLSHQLDEKEMANLKINPNRLPLKQMPFGNPSGTGEPTLFLIQDNSTSSVESQIAAFFKNDKAQQLVFQKYNQKVRKRSFRNG
ncbi:MAG: hypothetical protein R2828_04665 [Saprospiraceae bacterium]